MIARAEKTPDRPIGLSQYESGLMGVTRRQFKGETFGYKTWRLPSAFMHLITHDNGRGVNTVDMLTDVLGPSGFTIPNRKKIERVTLKIEGLETPTYLEDLALSSGRLCNVTSFIINHFEIIQGDKTQYSEQTYPNGLVVPVVSILRTEAVPADHRVEYITQPPVLEVSDSYELPKAA